MSLEADPLAYLLRLKAKGWLRSTRRRLSSWSGLLFAFIGLLVMALWLSSLLLRAHLAPPLELEPPLLAAVTSGFLLGMLVLVLSGALAHRGLYLPAEEIERLFSAPLGRRQLVRYRLWVHLAKSLPFMLILGLVFAPRMPQPGLAFPAIALAMATMTVLGQGLAVALGGAENATGRWASKLPVAPLRFVVGLAFWALFLGLFFADDLAQDLPGLAGGSLTERLESVASAPLFQAITWPLQPWARAITADSLVTWLPHAAAALTLLLVTAWSVVRLPVDFRTLSLATSADVARRLSKMRSGRGMISGAKAYGAGWRVPWLFGRGQLGAVAWLQLCSIVRKSRSTLLFYAFVMGVLTLSSLVLGQGGAESVGLGPERVESAALLALLGTIYLSMGLRFDFRSELDRMETVKAWPLSSWRIFLAMILPEVALVSGLVLFALYLRAAIVGVLPHGILWISIAAPFLAFVWTALDNAIYLLAPVRFTPEQGSSMHFAGRSVVLVFVRMVAISGLIISVAGTYLVVSNWLGTWPAGIAVSLVAGGIAYGLTAFGGWACARFDVAKIAQSN